MFEKQKHHAEKEWEMNTSTITPDNQEALEELIARTYSIEAVEDLRDILIEGIQKRPLLKRTLEMISVRIKASGKIPEGLDKDGNFIMSCECGEVNEVLVYLLYFITNGKFGEEIKPYKEESELQQDSLDLSTMPVSNE